MTEIGQGPTPGVRFRGVHFNEVSVKRELTVHCTDCYKMQSVLKYPFPPPPLSHQHHQEVNPKSMNQIRRIASTFFLIFLQLQAPVIDPVVAFEFPHIFIYAQVLWHRQSPRV